MKILIIEDNPEIIETVSLCFDLRWPDAQVSFATEGAVGVERIQKEPPDMVILDVGLPDIDGFEVCQQIRRFCDIPILMLTARDQELDKVKGLELGADDYVTKPFSHIEFLARVRAVMRRCSSPALKIDAESLAMGPITIDFTAREVRKDGKQIKLTPTEYKLFCHLARNAGKVMTHEALLEKIWGPEYGNSPDYLKVYIQRLRTKLDDLSDKPRLILSERGVGYRLVKPFSAEEPVDERAEALALTLNSCLTR